MSEDVIEHNIDVDGPLLDLQDIADLDDAVASNDEWAYQQADRMVRALPGREGRDRKTEGEVFDHQTLMVLHKFLVHGVLKSLDFPVSTGKEANVFRGTTPEGGLVAVKIFRTNTSTFKHVLQYIQGDERFQGVTGDKRSLVHAWAQKEFRNLHRMRDAGIDVPEPIRVMQNVLVMEYLGTRAGPWPRMQALGRLSPAVAQAFWDKLSADYARIVRKAGLIHADISEYNILVENADNLRDGDAGVEFAGEPRALPRIIDVGQAVLKNHPMGHEFMARDAKNLTSYFRKQKVRVAAEELIAQMRKEAGAA